MREGLFVANRSKMWPRVGVMTSCENPAILNTSINMLHMSNGYVLLVTLLKFQSMWGRLKSPHHIIDYATRFWIISPNVTF